MATKKKMLQAAAGNAGGAGLDVEDVFSTYLYTGTGAAQTITNGIDLDGEGGLVWVKERTSVGSLGWHSLFDTERGVSKYLSSNNTNAEASSAGVTAFNSNGFTLGSTNLVNQNTGDFASWTFRKAPKFFDVVTYTGDGTSSQTIPHNLGGEVGFVVVKKTSASGSWFGLHRNSGLIILNETGAAYSDAVTDGYFGDGTQVIRPTSTHFTIGSSGGLNDSGATLVAYLFAHNNGDGEFGPDGDADIIKCGSYDGNSTLGHTIDLGFEAQWVLVRGTSNLKKWFLYDAMRGMPVDGNGAALYPNDTDDEEALQRIGSSNVGFQLTSTDSMVNLSGETYIYIAIRRGTKVPESATEVFAIDAATQDSTAETQSLGAYDSGWFLKRTGSDAAMSAQRILPNRISFNTGQYASLYWDAGLNNSQGKYFAYSSDPTINYFLKRAPGFFDHLAYSGTGSVNTHQHNLTVQPEMMWVRKLNTGSADAMVYHKDLNANTDIRLNTDTPSTNANLWNNTRPTDVSFTVGTAGNTNDSEGFINFYAMLFASVSGVSKVGSYTGNGNASQNIDCGFSSGARFVLIKRTTTGTNYNSNWLVWDAVRGIVSGNDPLLYLNGTQTEITDEDFIDPYSSGFTILDNGTSGANVSGAFYIFYAIA